MNRNDALVQGKKEGVVSPSGATLQHSEAQVGLTVTQYASAAGLPETFLRGLGLYDRKVGGVPTLHIPYLNEEGEQVGIRHRVAMKKKDVAASRFRWKGGMAPVLYGADRMADIVKKGRVFLVRGELNCQVLRYYKFFALGIPSDALWNEGIYSSCLRRVRRVYFIRQKKDADIFGALASSTIRERLYLVELPQGESPVTFHRSGADFKKVLVAARNAARPFPPAAGTQPTPEDRNALHVCKELASAPDILGLFADELSKAGVVGERRNAMIIYLALTSRLFDWPVSIVVKGASSSGKSFPLEQILKFFPRSAFFAFSSASEKALLYTSESFKHRFLFIAEAAGVRSRFQEYLARTLLSEKRIKYEVTVNRGGVPTTVTVEKEGPIGLITTTTAPKINEENETRVLTINSKDTPAQTRQILNAIGKGEASPQKYRPDHQKWCTLQKWLEGGVREVRVSFSELLTDLIPPVATRLRRDINVLFSLIKAHALLHRNSRRRDADGSILATLDDYGKVRALVGNLFSEGAERSVSDGTRDTVEAVKEMMREQGNKNGVSVVALARRMSLDKSTVSRRIKAAEGYLSGSGGKKGTPAKIVIGDPLPEDTVVLPEVADVKREWMAQSA